jgi:hypothetical protein
MSTASPALHPNHDASGPAREGVGPTDLADIAAGLQESLRPYLAGESTGPVTDERRDGWLAEFRRRGTERLAGDLDANLAELTQAFAVVGRDPRVDRTLVQDAEDMLADLRALREEIGRTDPYRSAKIEEACWILVQQFYCDAITCAQRLTGVRRRPLPRDAQGALRRRDVMGITGPSRRQAALNATEVAVPNPLEARVVRNFGPTLAHMLWHQCIPWGELRWHDFERTTRGWLSPNGLSRLRGQRRRVVRVAGREHLNDNRLLIDPRTGRTPHHLVIAASHRLGFMDFPFFAEVLKDIPHFVWANNSFYTPGMARKLARSRSAIPVRGSGRTPFNEAIDLSIRNFEELGLPLFIMSDGATKNMAYGQYLRVKRGIRVLVDECARRGRKTGRRTFVVPMTFDDPFAYLLGFDDEIRVNLHPPIEIREPTSPDAFTSVFDEARFNGGDPLLNQLEALYLAHTLQARHGFFPIRVLAALADWRAAPPRGLRGRLRRRFNMSVYDLCRLNAAQWRKSQVPPSIAGRTEPRP